MSSSEHDRLRELLQAQHAFPGPFFVTVITVTADDVHRALRAAVAGEGELPIVDWSTRASSRGRYTSHRVTVTCQAAEDVLALYGRVRSVEGVVTCL